MGWGRFFRLYLGGLLAGCILVSCIVNEGAPVVNETPVKSDSCEGVSIANPAASYCSLLGYETRIMETAEGQAGACVFPDGSSCDAWEFLRGTCGQDFSWCALNGMEIQTVTESDGSSTQVYGVCIDANGNTVGKVLDLSGLQSLLDGCRPD